MSVPHVDGSPILTSARQLNFDQLPETLVRLELGRKQVLGVEDWAEIRRLRRSEGLPIAEIGRLLGISRNTVKAALASDGPPQYRRAPAGSGVDVAEPRIRELLTAVSADAGDGDRGADRLGALDPDAVGSGRGAAAGVSAAGSGVADDVFAG